MGVPGAMGGALTHTMFAVGLGTGAGNPNTTVVHIGDTKGWPSI